MPQLARDFQRRESLLPALKASLGIDGLAWRPETENPAEGSVIISRRRNVHLDGRTQIMLQVKGK
jgi:hypothetical protein